MKKFFGISIWLLIWFSVQPMLAQQGTQLPTLENWLQEYRFFGRSVRGINSMADGLHYTSLVGRGTVIQRSAYETGLAVDTLFNLKDIEEAGFESIDDYSFSSDEQQILLATQIEPIYRRSFTAQYYIFNRDSKKLIPLSNQGAQQLASFNPKGTHVAFVRENNIFLVNLNDYTETQITFDGERNKIINGAPDWVYEEEFGFSQAFHWSEGGDKIAFIRFDEREVKEFGMTMFAGQAPELSSNLLYPEHRVWKYPKAGEGNSIVSVHVYDINSGKTTNMDIGSETDLYIPRIKWTRKNDVLCIYRLNRLQNELELLSANAMTGQSHVFYKETNAAYLSEEYFDDLYFLPNGKEFIWLSEKSGFTHLYLHQIDGKELRALTQGSFDVTEFVAYDEKEQRVYYQSAEESPLQRGIYSVNLKGKRKKTHHHEAGWNNVQFSKSFEYFILTHSTANTPYTYTLCNKKGKKIRVLEDNQALVTTLSEYRFNAKEFFEFTTSDGITLNGSIIKPIDFDPGKHYPVLMTQYSGPNSQQVVDRWSFGWEQIMAAQGYLIVTVDGRGTGARGEAFRKSTYLQLGKYETIDQIEAAKYLQTLSYVDGERIGIWGWSFGGFVSTLALMKGEGIFKAGIAVAPVTNWRYYDNIYTERFLRTPQENATGYDENSPLFFADQLEGNYLLIHGTADDNVHWQNAAELAERLVQADKDFEMFYYTNRNHGIYGGNTRYHLYKKKTRFLLENL